jgi:hypothetical protein
MNGEHLGSNKPIPTLACELLTPAELASRLRVPVSWIREGTRSRNMIGDDPIPHLRLGRYIRFQWGSPELEAWLKRRLFAKSLQSNTALC